MRGGLNLAFLHPHYNHCHAVQHRVDCGSVRSQPVTRRSAFLANRCTREFHAPKADSSFVISLVACSLKEHIAFGQVFACRTRSTTLRSNWVHLSHERLLRGVAAAKGLSCRRGLHRRRRILDSNRLGGVSSMGIAELEFATRDCAFVNRFSDCSYTRLGIRHHAARNPGHANNTRSSSATKSHFAHRLRCHHLCFGWIFSIATSRLG